MEIKQTYRTPYMSIDLCKKEDSTWMILLTKCTGQKTENYKNWNEAQKGLASILWLTNAIRADRKWAKLSPAGKGIPGESIHGTYQAQKN